MGDPSSAGAQTETNRTMTTPPQGEPAEVHAPTPPADAPSAEPGQSAAPAEGSGGNGGGAEAQPAPSGGKVYTIAENAFKRLKDEQREKGRKEAIEQFAKDNGFESAEAMQAAFKRRDERRRKKESGGDQAPTRRRAKPPRASSEPDDAGTDASGGDDSGQLKQLNRNLRRLERRVEESEGKNADLAQRMQKEAALRKKAQLERDALEAEMAVRVAAATVGIRDPDYAMRLMAKELQGKDEKFLTEFDEAKYFSGLRQTHPYLFGETTKPATTGNGAGTSPGAPNPGAAQEGAAQGGKVDARKMSREEYLKHIQSRGLNLSI